MTAHATELRDRLEEVLGSDYRIEREVGGGGMSRVFAARDQKLNRDVVVKVLPPELSGDVNIERFKREIIFAASLQHPHIVPVHTAGDVDGLPYYTMPLVEGESLRSRLVRVQRLSVTESLRILRDIVRALSYAHRRGVVHRDIKPENVLMSDGVAVVTDFGIAKAIAESREESQVEPVTTNAAGLTVTGSGLGTPAYMAPEQALGNPRADHRSDLYALGVVAYELLTGAVPFSERPQRERMAAQLTERPKDVGTLRLDVPPAVNALVMQCLEKEPEARPQSADEVLQAIEGALAGPVLPVAEDEPAVIRRAYLLYALTFAAATGLAWLAMNAIGLPDWVVPGTILIMTAGFFVVTFTAVGRYAAFKLLNAAEGGRPGPMPWQQTTGARSLWIAEHVSWRRVAAGGTLALGGFGALVAGFMYARDAGIGPFGSLIGKGAIQAQERVLFTSLDVTGVDSGLASAISLAARTALQQSRAITVMTTGEVQGALARMRKPANARIDLELGRELATREGVRALVAGQVTPAGRTFTVSLRLVSADSGRELAAAQGISPGLEGIIPTIDAVSRDLRGRIGESLRTVRATAPLPQATTSSITALRLYDESIGADPVKAWDLLKQAVAADSEFAMAYRRMWILRAGTPEGDSAGVKAVRLRSRLPELEQLVVDGAHYTALYLFPDADRKRAVTAYEQLAARGNALGMQNLPEVLNNMRLYARAESADRANVTRFPDNPGMREGLVHRLIELNRLDEAERAVDSGLVRFPQHWMLQWWKIRMLYYRGEIDAFERALDSLSRAPELEKRRVVANMRSEMALLRGRLRERDLRLAEAQGLTQATGRPVNLSPMRRAREDLFNAGMLGRDRTEIIKRLEALQAQAPPRDAQRAMDIVFWFAEIGQRPDIARQYYERYLAGRPDSARASGAGEHFTPWALFYILLAENKPREAIEQRWLGDRFRDGFPGPCHLCLYRDLGRAYDQLGHADSTILLFEKFVNEPSQFTLQMHPGFVHLYLRRLGELYEQKGNRAKAIEYYNRFIELWKNADPELQPQVADLRARVVRLRS